MRIIRLRCWGHHANNGIQINFYVIIAYLDIENTPGCILHSTFHKYNILRVY